MFDDIQIRSGITSSSMRTTSPVARTVSDPVFGLLPDGKITALILDTKTTSSDQGTRACASAITTPAPYEKWTQEMITMFGDSQDMTMTFYYLNE